MNAGDNENIKPEEFSREPEVDSRAARDEDGSPSKSMSRTRSQKEIDISDGPSKPVRQEETGEPIVEDEVEDEGEVTRCICGHDELETSNIKSRSFDPGLFIQCDECQVWQHGFCVGFMDEEQVPDVYYCETCRPEFHFIVNRPWGRNSMYNPDKKDDTKRKRKDKRRSETGGNQPLSNSQSSHGDSNNQSNNHSNNHHSNTSQTQSQAHQPKTPRSRAGSRRESLGHGVERGGTERGNERDKEDAEVGSRSRRRTLNSRDAEYEETLKRVLEESARGQQSDGSGNDNNDPDGGTNSETTNLKEGRYDDKPSIHDRRLDLNDSYDQNHINGDDHETGKLESGDQSQSKNGGGKRKVSGYTQSLEHSNHNMNNHQPQQTNGNSHGNNHGHDNNHEDMQRHLGEAEASSTDDRDLRPSKKRRQGRAGRSEVNNDVGAAAPEADDSALDQVSQSENDGGSGLRTRTRGTANGSMKRGSEEDASESVSGTGPVNGKTRPKRKKKASGGSGNGSGSNAGGAGNGSSGGRSKPRIPSSRSTLNEMRKRVAAICEFLSRTQADLDLEEQDRRHLVQESAIRRRNLGLPDHDRFDSLFAMHPSHLEQMGALNDKLSEWEAKFGKFGDE